MYGMKVEGDLGKETMFRDGDWEQERVMEGTDRKAEGGETNQRAEGKARCI